MPTLAELVAERRATIDEFKSDIYSHPQHDISVLTDAIAKTPAYLRKMRLLLSISFEMI